MSKHAKRKRPANGYPVELGPIILERLENGESLRAICKTKGFPHESTVRKWAREEPEFGRQYQLALELGCDAMADEIIEISDDARNDWMETNDPDNPGYKANLTHIARSRLMTDNRKWWLSKRMARVYGDKQAVEHTGADGGAIELNVRKIIVEHGQPEHKGE